MIKNIFYSIKVFCIKEFKERFKTKSTLIAITILALLLWQYKLLLSILNDYLHSDSFKYIVIGWIQAYIAYLGLKRG
jgi:hypothetical protein